MDGPFADSADFSYFDGGKTFQSLKYSDINILFE